jgi:hypothetical protein
VAIVGRDGIGKTAIVSKLFGDLRTDPGPPLVDAFIYLPAHGSRLISPVTLLEALRKVIPDQSAASHLAERRNDATLTLPEKLSEVVDKLAGSRVLVVIDNGEDLLDSGMRLRDPELDEMARALLLGRDHGVKLVFVTREAPEPLLREFAAARPCFSDGRGAGRVWRAAR